MKYNKLFIPMRTVFQLQKNASLLVIVIKSATVGGTKSEHMMKVVEEFKSKLSKFGGFFNLIEVDGRTTRNKVRRAVGKFAKHKSTEKFLLIMGHGTVDHLPGNIWLRYVG